MTSTANHCTITHDFPALRDHADFILTARLVGDNVPRDWTWEQIWARQLSDNRFEICCIPFATYGLALGDIVNTAPMAERTYVVYQVLVPSGHATYRLWYPFKEEWHGTIDDLLALGCRVEVRREMDELIAIDSPTDEVCADLESYLQQLEGQGHGITWESGM